MPTGARRLRVIFLATEAHGGFGGIAQYNCDMIEAISKMNGIKELVVLPRLVRESEVRAPLKVTYDLGGAAGLVAFLRRCVAYSLARNQVDLVYCAHINLLPAATIIAKMHRVPLILAIYGIDAWQRPASTLIQPALRCVNLVISISELTLKRFQSWSRARTASFVVLPNAVHIHKYAIGTKNDTLRKRLGVDGVKVILTLGRMSASERYKGFDEVIESLPRLRRMIPNIIYLAAGDGDDRLRLETKSAELGVSDLVVFTGHIDEVEKPDIYGLADAFIMPSSGEGFGFVVLEALASGLPVVASSTDGTREALRGGELGILIDPKSPEELEQAILCALERPKMIPAGLEYFSVKNFEQRVHSAFADVLQI